MAGGGETGVPSLRSVCAEKFTHQLKRCRNSSAIDDDQLIIYLYRLVGLVGYYSVLQKRENGLKFEDRTVYEWPALR